MSGALGLDRGHCEKVGGRRNLEDAGETGGFKPNPEDIWRTSVKKKDR